LKPLRRRALASLWSSSYCVWPSGKPKSPDWGGLGRAVTRCTSDVLPDVLLAALWREAPAARAVVAQMDALLSQRQINGEVGCA